MKGGFPVIRQTSKVTQPLASANRNGMVNEGVFDLVMIATLSRMRFDDASSHATLFLVRRYGLMRHRPHD